MAAAISTGRAEAFTAKWGGNALSRPRAMLDAGESMPFYICTPTGSHNPASASTWWAQPAALCGETVDFDLKLAARFVEAAEQRKLITMTRFGGAIRRLSPRPGADRRRTRRAGDTALVLDAPPIPWMWDRTLAGGQLVDPEHPSVDVERRVGRRHCDGLRGLQRAAGQPGSRVSQLGCVLRRDAALQGAAPSAPAPAPTPSSRRSRSRPRPDFALRDRLVRVTDAARRSSRRRVSRSGRTTSRFARRRQRAFVEALRKNDPSLVATPLRAGLESTAVVLAANASAATGQPVDVAAPRRQCMSAAWVDEHLGTPEFYADPYPVLRRLLRRRRSWSERMGGWLVTRYADVVAARDPHASRMPAAPTISSTNSHPEQRGHGPPATPLCRGCGARRPAEHRACAGC